jgi:tRNA threonylcarbamoyladenosine biosynthesis protein TsaB
MRVLSCDTSTQIMHLGLIRFEGDEPVEWETTSLVCGTRHSELLVDRILDLCANNKIEIQDLDLLVAPAGPGSFTGLRIAIATLKGIGLASGIPLVTVDTLEGWYHTVSFVSVPVLVVLDAKKRRFYSSLYVRGERLWGPSDLTIEQLKERMLPYPGALITGLDAAMVAPLLGEGYSVGASDGSALSLALARLGMQHYRTRGADSPYGGAHYVRASDAEEALLQRIHTSEEEK